MVPRRAVPANRAGRSSLLPATRQESETGRPVRGKGTTALSHPGHRLSSPSPRMHAKERVQ